MNALSWILVAALFSMTLKATGQGDTEADDDFLAFSSLDQMWLLEAKRSETYQRIPKSSDGWRRKQ